MKYLFDNDISFRFAAMLRALGVDAVALRDIYLQNVKDVDFLGEMHEKHGIDAFFSHNTAQRTHPVESVLLKGSGVTCLYLNPFWCKLGFWQQAK